MNISFRSRILLVATLIVCAVLALVMALGWSSILGFEVERLDGRLCMEAKRVATTPPDEGPMRDLDVDLVGKLHLDSMDQLLFRQEPSGEQSAHWLAGLGIDALNWSPAKRQDGPARLAERRRPMRERDVRPARPADGACSLASFEGRGAHWRAALFTASEGRGFVGVDLTATKSELQAALRSALWIVVPGALLLSAAGAWLLATLTMRPLNRLREAMKQVTQQALDQRLSREGEDREFRELIDAYNTMLARLEASFQQASRFSADAAHELRTPLTILQGRIEQALNAGDGQRQLDLTSMLDEVGRLAAITRKLLLLSQADAGRLSLYAVPIELSGVLKDLLADAQMLLSDQQLVSEIAPGLRIEGDTVLLRQLLNNLLSNAVRYCRPGGRIDIKAQSLPNGIELIFSNASEPIPAAERAHFFDRFHRGQVAHQRGIEGSGLGLSLAREIAHAHHGELSLEPSPVDEVRLRLWLPAHR